MKAEFPRLPQLPASRNEGQPLKLISGSLQNLPIGPVITVSAQKGDTPGSALLIVKGQTLQVEGIPAKALEQPLQLMLRNTANGPQLIWLSAKENAHLGQQSREHAGSAAQSHGKSAPALHTKHQANPHHRVHLLGDISPSLAKAFSAGQSVHGHISQLKQGKMTLLLQPSPTQATSGHGKPIPEQPPLTVHTSAVPGLKAGQAITAKLLQRSPGQTMLSIGTTTPAAGIHTSAVKSGTSQDASTLNMQAGEKTVGWVTRRLSPQDIEIHVKGMHVRTQAPATVKAGDALMLHMPRQGVMPEVVQVIPDASGKAGQLLRQNLINAAPLAQSLKEMLPLQGNPHAPAPATTAPAGTDPLGKLTALMVQVGQELGNHDLNGPRLQQLLQNSGMFLEQKLASAAQSQSMPAVDEDMKALLLQVADERATPHEHRPHQTANSIREAAQQSIARLEAGQAFNLLTGTHHEASRFELPLLAGQQIMGLQLAIHRDPMPEHDADAGSANSDQTLNVLFALELSYLGKMRIDTHISTQSVHARFYTATESSRDFLSQHLPRLESQLHALGFAEVQLLAANHEPVAEKQQQFDQLERATPVNFGLLNVRV